MQQRIIRLIDPVEAIKGTAIAALVAAVFAFIQNTWKKAVKADVDTIIATARTDAATAVATAKAEAAAGIVAMRLELKERTDTIERRISAWEQKSERFVTRDVIIELEKKMSDMEGRIGKAIDRLTDKFDDFLKNRERHS